MAAPKRPDIQMLGEIVETIFLDLDAVDAARVYSFMEELVDFCIDGQGVVRKSVGPVSYDEASDNDMNYVPRNRYEIKACPWNSHSNYVEITLPNPIDDFDRYKFIRDKMGAELIHRLHTLPLKEADDGTEA